MKKVMLVLALSAAVVTPVVADDMFTGDKRLACEAILCLASGTRPNECMPSIRKFFSISFRKFSDTMRGRADFLNLCPAANTDQKMNSLTNAIVNGAGQCEVAALNSNQLSWRGGDNDGYYISNVMPSSCSTLVNHSYTDLKATVPVYVGVPMRNGYWVAPAEYAQALKSYDARVAAEDAAAAASARDSGGH